MKAGTFAAVIAMMVLLSAGFAATSEMSPVTGPVAICSGGASAYCFTSSRTTFYLLGMWVIIGSVFMGSLVNRVRKSLQGTSSNGSKAPP